MNHVQVNWNILLTGIKDYSNWPTIPQTYFNGEFIGGCDVLLEMHKNGELIEELKSVGIRSALLDKKEETWRNEYYMYRLSVSYMCEQFQWMLMVAMMSGYRL